MQDLTFDMPQNQSSTIKVIGVGGGGSNAVNYMYNKGIRGVDFVVCNTDQQSLDDSPVPTKIQLGVSVTEGLGAGAWPLKGRMAAEENIQDVIDVLENNTKMVFINAGMGGGTGTGAAPIIAKASKDMDILTVAIVTIPFIFEGELRMSQAKDGIEELKNHVDSLIVINNDKLREIYGDLGFKSGFAKADEILATASRGIAEVITQKGHLNIDLNDARTVLQNSGTAIMGSGTALGDGRAIKAVKSAIESPLLDNNHIRGAKKVLLLIVSGTEEVTFEEMGEISDFIQDQVMLEGGSSADIIMGVAEDHELDSAVNVTVVATGFHVGKLVNPVTGTPEKVVHDLDDLPCSQSLINKVKDTTDNNIENLDVGSDKKNSEELIPKNHNVAVNSNLNYRNEEKSDDINQVSMTFDLDISNKIESNREKPKIVFDLIDEIEKESEDKDVFKKESIVLNSHEESEIPFSREISQSIEENQGEKLSDSEKIYHTLNEEDLNPTMSNDISLPKVTNTFSSESKIFQDQIDRAKKRKERLQKFNYRFRKNSVIENVEHEPAYKRQGVDLDSETHSSNDEKSRCTLETNDEGEVQIKNKNTFFHDNVD